MATDSIALGGLSASRSTVGPPRELRPLRLLLPVIVPVAFIALWEYAAKQEIINTLLFPAPSAIWDSAVSLAQSGALWDNVKASASLQLSGLVLGSFLGIVFGLAIGLWRAVEDLLDTSMLLLQVVPTIALIPLFIVWFGGLWQTRLIVVAISVYFPVYIATLAAVRMVDRKLLEVGEVLGFTSRQKALTVLIPSALPQILVGIRQSLKNAWVGVVAAEMFIGASAGIYFMMDQARSFAQTPTVYVGLILFGLLGALTDAVMAGVQRFVVPWEANRKRRSLL